MNSHRLVVTIGILLLSTSFSAQTPGISSEYADANGTFARFEKKFVGESYYINLGSNSIQSIRNPSLFSPLTTPLFLNPEEGTVTIGPYLSDVEFANATLTVTSIDDITDIRMLGHGRLSSQGSIFTTLDDNNNAYEYFGIKGSTYNDLFFIGENGNNRLNGNLHIKGAIKENITKFHVINFTDFEVIEDFGDELDVGTRWVASDGGPGKSWIGASIHLPHMSTIKTIKIFYFDNDDDGYMDIYFNSSQGGPDLIFQGNRTGSIGAGEHILIYDQVVDYSNNIYFISAESEEWEDQGIQHILISYETK